MPRQPIAFDYAAITDEQVRAQVQIHTTAITEHLRKTSVMIIDIGRRLTEVRELLQDRFRTWLDVEFPWSASTAKNYMSAYRCFGHLDCIEQFRSTALLLLMRKSAPTAAVSEAIAMAQSGQRVSKLTAESLIRKYTLREQGVSEEPLPQQQQQQPQKKRLTRRSATLLGRVRSVLSRVDELATTLPPDERRNIATDLISVARQIREGKVAGTPEATASV